MAVTVRLEVPVAAVEAADTVNVLVPLPGAAMLVGARLAVTPAGAPLTDNAIAELNPVPFAVVNVIGTEPPGATLAALAPAVRVNVPATVTLTD